MAKTYSEFPNSDIVDAKIRDALTSKADKVTTLAGYGITDAYTKTETEDKISAAVSAEETARNTAIANAINAVKDSAPEAFDTLKEIADWIEDDQSGAAAMAAQISSHTAQLSQLSQNKVDKVAGKELSTNDYTTEDKEKLAGVEAGAQVNAPVDSALSDTSENAVQNKVVKVELDKKYEKPSTGIPASDLADGALAGKADKPATFTAGNLAEFDSNGNPTDSTIPAANVAVKGEIPYALVTKTISNGAVSLDDRAINAVAVSSSLASLTVNFPTATSGRVRDFAMRLNIAAGVTAPEIAWPQGVTLENNGGEVPEIADGGTGGSSTILYFSETENNGTTAKFLVKSETLAAIMQA